jgi:hypothetical protein
VKFTVAIFRVHSFKRGEASGTVSNVKVKQSRNYQKHSKLIYSEDGKCKICRNIGKLSTLEAEAI